MTVTELVAALQKAKNQNAPVRILDKQGNGNTDIFTVDEDDEQVNIVVEDE